MNNLNDQMELMAETCEQGLNLVASPTRSPTNDENCTPRDACVMIIDDESINIEIVKAYLEEEGFENLVARPKRRRPWICFANTSQTSSC